VGERSTPPLLVQGAGSGNTPALHFEWSLSDPSGQSLTEGMTARPRNTAGGAIAVAPRRCSMDPSCLQFVLTPEERAQFEEFGYLVVPGALAPEHTAQLTAELDALDARFRAGAFGGPPPGPQQGSFIPNFVGRSRSFLELVDWPVILPRVWGILGWNIYLYHCHAAVNPPGPPVDPQQRRALGWHQDSGRVNLDIETHPRPRLSLKVAYFLSDCSEPGRGNFHVIPGSHRLDTLDRPQDGLSDPPEAVAVCVRPGDAVFFDRRLWHAGSPNHSTITRKVLFYGYGYRWLRTKDDMTIPGEWFAESPPIRQQLLGGTVNCNGRFSPTDADVPLRAWLREHLPEAAA
jgi:ectoine hydroxylase